MIKFETKDWIEFYNQKKELLEQSFKETSAVDFYRDMFPKGSLQKKGELYDEAENFGERKGNIIATSIHKGKDEKTRTWIVTDDLEDLKNVVGVEFGLIAPLSWFGKTHRKQNAHELFAYVIDIDYVDLQRLKNLLKQFRLDVQPKPNYIVSSGRGLHLYYFLEKPIPLYSNLIDMLSQFKKDLIRRLWNDTSSLKPDVPDITGIFQGFRSVGSLSKLGAGYPVRAYKMSDRRWTLAELKKYCPNSTADVELVDRKPDWTPKKNRISLEEALEKYPDWYERKILKHEKTVAVWHSNPKMYEWWKKKILLEVRAGGRYYSLVALCSFGRKCGISDEQIKSDCQSFLEYLETLTDDDTNHFTQSDVDDAIKSLDNPMIAKATREWISEHSKVEIKINKRNGRTQADHIKLMNKMRDLKIELGETSKDWAGRKSVQDKVFDFLDKNPKATCKDFCEQTDLKKSVFYKYKQLWQAKKQDEYKHYRNGFALASLFDNCVKDAQTGQTIDLAELITGIPTPKEPLSYEEFLDMKSKMA